VRNRAFNVGIIGPSTHVSASSKIAFNQANCLARRGHEVEFVLQGRGLDSTRRLYAGLAEGVHLTELYPVPLFSSFFNRVTARFRRLFGGANAPITQDVWYRVRSQTHIPKTNWKKEELTEKVNVDLAAMLLRSPSVSKLLANKGCQALICHATLMVIPALPLYATHGIRKLIYLHDIPIAKILEIEGRSSSSPTVKVFAKFEKWVVDNSDALACSTKVHIRDWLEWYGVKPTHIPPGCNPSPDFPLHRSNYALTVTYWSPDKRPFFFLDLADLLRESNLQLVMAGHWPDPNDLKEMRDRIKQRNLNAKLTIVPDPTESELEKLYCHAKCFVAAPKSGGHMMAGLEAAAFGTPIIYPKVAGAWDMFTAGVHGFVANIEDVEHVGACIRKFEDDDLSYDMGHKIWLRAKELSWEAHASAIERLLSA
jgi:glycosyltransferase involved in cell wall biosynthesis